MSQLLIIKLVGCEAEVIDYGNKEYTVEIPSGLSAGFDADRNRVRLSGDIAELEDFKTRLELLIRKLQA